MPDLKTLYLIAHVFGAIIGAGGAFVGDALFLASIKDGKINADELRLMKVSSKLVWSGVILLVLSGILLVTTDPARYLASDKFLAKVTIVAIIILNGIIFHLIHIPHIKKHLELKLSESETFMKRGSFILVSGALSMVSWVSTVILGMLRKTPFSYMQIMGIYLLMVLVAMTGAVLMKKIIIR